MPRSEEDYRRIRERQKARILKAAKTVFFRKGGTATMADIAAEAEISQGLAYRYFANKDAIILELMKELVDSNLKEIERVSNFEGTSAQRLELIVSELLKRVENFEFTIQAMLGKEPSGNRIDFIHTAVQNMYNGNEKEKETVELMKKQYFALVNSIRNIITEGQKAGEFIKEDPDKLTVMILCCVKGLVSLAIHRPDQFEAYYPYTGIIMRILKNDNHIGQ
ncbi:hypothetical protein SDC9_70131 [bioreactor metagenome]|uniref:HTH tetR-type domain-containing protein n=1 Tax=bioreactor metagenome TaxID=1076179 RepID=A0A644Y649_9ZZZZ